MKKSSIRILAIVLIVSLTLPFASAGAVEPVALHYVALGDSISAYFRVEKGQGYAEILADFLKNEPGFEGLYLTNLSKSGDDSTDILNMVDAYEDVIRGSDLITISIGGNNFLGLILNSISGFLEERFGPDYAFGNIEIDADQMAEMASALGGLSFIFQVGRGIDRLRTDIATLIEKLKGLAPSAEICFMTIYNPMSESDLIFEAADMLIATTNSIIAENAGLGYTVVDVYGAFRESDAEGLSFIDLQSGSFDPHPSIMGHRLIAETHFRAITGRELIIPEDYAPIVPLRRSEAISSMTEGAFSLSIMFMTGSAGVPGEMRGFNDLPPYHPLYRQIAGARSFGIINGVGSDLFLPDAYMTRQDYSVALQRLFLLLESLGYPPDVPVSPAESLPGIESAAPYAVETLTRFAGTPLLPFVDGMVEPLAPITSQELAALKVVILASM